MQAQQSTSVGQQWLETSPVAPQVNDSRSHIIQQSSNVFSLEYREPWASQVAPAVKSLPANAGDFRDTGSIPGSGRSPGGGHRNPLQCSCLENPHGWWATVRRVTESQTRQKQLSIAQHSESW